MAVWGFDLVGAASFDLAGMAFSAAFILALLAAVFLRMTAAESVPIERNFLYRFSRRLSIFVRFKAASVLMMYLSTLLTVS